MFSSVDAPRSPSGEMVSSGIQRENPQLSTHLKLAALHGTEPCFSVSYGPGVCVVALEGELGQLALIAAENLTNHLKIQKFDSDPKRNWCDFELHSCYLVLNFKCFYSTWKICFSPNLTLSILLFLARVLKCST